MTVASMTGFARAAGERDGFGWSWELKSVNARGLDVRCRLPAGYDQLEPAVRSRIAARLGRGNVSVQLALTRAAAGGRLRVNRPLLDELLALCRELSPAVGAPPPRIDTLLAIRGVVEEAAEEPAPALIEARGAAMLADLETAVAALAAARAAEGAHLTAALVARLDEIEALLAAAEEGAAERPAAMRARLEAQLAALLTTDPPVSEERLAQELALLAAKGDLREELDRLAAHVAAARGLLAEGGTIGRRLDFLCQEFNREANTLCAKASDLAVGRIGLQLKAAIEQLREQVQNVE